MFLLESVVVLKLLEIFSSSYKKLNEQRLAGVRGIMKMFSKRSPDVIDIKHATRQRAKHRALSAENKTET